MDLETLKTRSYQYYVLTIVSIGYTLAELGHYLIGITSRETARDVRYGDQACVLNTSMGLFNRDVPQECELASDFASCLKLELNGTKYCEWDFNGRGMEYQAMAGPGFTVPLSVVGILMGILSDRYNRVYLLTACSFMFSISFMLLGTATEYWQLLFLRTFFAAGEAGCNPVATGILSDLFPQKIRGLVMAVFNWGIYGGYGVAFPVGHYLTSLNVWGLGWRLCYYSCGAVALFVTILTMFTVKEPERTLIGEEKEMRDRGEIGKEGISKEDGSLWKVLLQPRISVLCIAAAFRSTGGAVFAYNCDLYYRQYFPGYDLAWYLFVIFCISGSVGVAFGGIISDRLVDKFGITARVAVLAISQFLAFPFAFGSVYLSPLWAMICLGFSFFFAEMWFGSLFAVIVEMVPLAYRSFTISFFLFSMNMLGGVASVIVEPVAKAIGFRESLFVFYVGFYFISSVLFFLTMCFMKKPSRSTIDLAFDNKAMSVKVVSDLPNESS